MKVASLGPRVRRHFALMLAVLVLPYFRSAVNVQSTSVIVSNCTEAGLREAIANGGLITFSCGAIPVTITVTAELLVTQDTTIDGGGLITISGGHTTRVFHTSNYVFITLQNLTISDGKPLTGNGSGAALYGGWRGGATIINCRFENNDGTSGNTETGGGAIFVAAGSTLIIRDSTFIGNRGTQGGAINNLLSSLTVENSQFINNDSTAGGTVGYGYGGAIYTDGASEHPNDAIGGQIRISHSIFRGNIGAGQGGAVQAWVYPPDQVVVSDTTFDSNQVIPRPAGDAYGGALRLGNGQMTVVNSTFVNNLARDQGGAIWIGGDNTTVTLNNTTIANNSAVSANGVNGLGGGIMMAGGALSVDNSTLANNQAGFMGGGIYGGGANIMLRNTIIASNTAGNPWAMNLQCSKVLIDGGNNLQYPDNNPTDPTRPECTTGIQVSDPRLDSLRDNGGPTWTIALLPGSPAIDHGNSATCLPADQRGILRTQGAACDIGAFEVVKHLSLQPAIVFVGDPVFTLAVLGDNFAAGNVIRWAGEDLPTSVIDRFTLHAIVPSLKLASPTTISITVDGSNLTGAQLQVLFLRSRIFLPVTLNN